MIGTYKWDESTKSLIEWDPRYAKLNEDWTVTEYFDDYGCSDFMEKNYNLVDSFPSGEGEICCDFLYIYEKRSSSSEKLPRVIVETMYGFSVDIIVFDSMIQCISYVNRLMPFINFLKERDKNEN